MNVEQLELLRRFAKRLEEAGFRYMVSGSMALTFYGLPRMTRDVDLVIELSPDDAPAFASILGADWYFDEDTMRDAIARRSMFNAIHNATMLKFDFIVRKDEPYRIEEFSRRVLRDLPGAKIWMVAAEDLVLSKLVWAKDSESELQLRDVRSMLATATIDQDYLVRWAAKLGVADLLAKARTTT